MRPVSSGSTNGGIARRAWARSRRPCAGAAERPADRPPLPSRTCAGWPRRTGRDARSSTLRGRGPVESLLQVGGLDLRRHRRRSSVRSTYRSTSVPHLTIAAVYERGRRGDKLKPRRGAAGHTERHRRGRSRHICLSFGSWRTSPMNSTTCASLRFFHQCEVPWFSARDLAGLVVDRPGAVAGVFDDLAFGDVDQRRTVVMAVPRHDAAGLDHHLAESQFAALDLRLLLAEVDRAERGVGHAGGASRPARAHWPCACRPGIRRPARVPAKAARREECNRRDAQRVLVE